MGKKIGILTYHRADNLGAVLQAYALQRVLSDTFHMDAEIVDYHCPGIEEEKHYSSVVRAMLLRCYHMVKHAAFEKFRKQYCVMSKSYDSHTLAQCGNEYDAFITGSDQVWNYECSGWDDAYFLSFAPSEKKKFSYAASLGRYRFTEEEKKTVKIMLQDYAGISVREVSAQRELETMGLTDITISADPAVLLSKDEWMQIMSGRLYHGKYVFAYLIMDSQEVLRAAKRYAADHGCKVICNKTSPEFILHGSPSDFLSWIYYSEAVFTNSFHGTAFSLILDKPLAAHILDVQGKLNERVYEMLEKTNAEACTLNAGVEVPHRPGAEKRLQEMKAEAYQYLGELCKSI